MSSSENVAASKPASSETPAPRSELDVPKLHALSSEQQDLYLLTFTSDLVQHVQPLDKGQLSSQQAFLKKELLKILTLSSPTLTRVIRNNLGRCFATLFGKGDRNLLYDTVHELLGIVNAGKTEAELKTKHAAAHCLGEVFAAAGESAVSLASIICSSLMKLLKSAQSHTGLRSSIYASLRKVIVGIGSPLDEVTAKEIWKTSRNAISGDKAIVVQISASRCLEQLIKTTHYFQNLNDFDNLKTTIWKVIDSPTPSVRHAVASCLATMLVKAHSINPRLDLAAPKPRKSKKQPKRQTSGVDDADEIEPPESPAQRKSEAQLSFTLPDLLRQLSVHYLRTSTGNRARAGIAVCYKNIIRNLGDRVVEDRYIDIANHLLFDLLNHPTVTYNRFRLLMTRKFIRNILEDTIGREILRENSQLNAARWLINDVLKDYPQVVQERKEPSKYTLTSALSALSCLISSLGSAVGVVGDICREALLQVLPHPSYTVQIHVSQCLRNFALACPHQLISCVTVCMNSVNREISQMATTKQSSRRCLGFANGLAAMLSTSRLQPLYGSVEVYSRVLSQATDLLKTSGSSELRAASTQIQVAWILIGGLMALGPNFAKVHLPQLMLLWKNALPKPLGKENLSQRGLLEMSFLAHVRECALGSILVFLEFNSKLVTVDGSRRIAAMLQNTISFLDELPRPKSAEDISQRLFPTLQLHDFSTMVRRRVLQCFSKLVNLEHADVLSQSNLLSLAISSFADPGYIAAKPQESSISSSTSNFENLWDLGDNFGFGLSGLVRGQIAEALHGRRPEDSSLTWSAFGSEELEIDDTLNFPICRAREHDSLLLYSVRDRDDVSFADPPATEVVNAAINLFSVAFPIQGPKVQESSLEQIATLLSAQSLQRNQGRKAAMTVNVAVALLNTLKVAVKETSSAPGDLKHAATEKIMQELLMEFTMNLDPIVRNVGFEGLGRLCNSSGNVFTSNQINSLVDKIVENRDPNARAGCAAALGCIHSQVGGMAAGYHLKTIVGVLMSLCSDPHPVVHFWALEGLERVADSAGLTFSAYVSSSLGMLAELYIVDTHNEESESLSTSNMEAIFPTPVAVSRCVDALINVLGPDLQDISKTRDLIFTLVKQFQFEDNIALKTESSKCLDHLSLYSPTHMGFTAYVRRLQEELRSTNPLVRDAAIYGLNNIMKRDADRIIRTATPTLEDEIWLTLDDIPDNKLLKSIISNWLQQTGISDTDLWIQRCQNVLTKTRVKADDLPTAPVKAAGPTDIQDDEVAGFAAAAGVTQDDSPDNASSSQELLKWQTRNFAIGCLSELVSMVHDEILPDQTIPSEAALQHKIGDIVRMAFSASTANVVELRVWGLKIIDQVLKMFGKAPDPDFAEASLLEQYQAQIGSALTPAFAADSSPELASGAINVCATFVGTGIVTNVDRMGRIFKLLVVGLENFAKTPDITEIGDLKGLNSNARVMVKMALYSAWARLQIASAEQSYLVEVVQPYTAMLTPLWLSSLQEFARLRFEPEISDTMGTSPLSANLDEVYAALNRETLLKFYQDSWLNIVDAIASLVEKDSEFVFDALDGKFESPEDKKEEKEGEAEAPATNGEKQGKGNKINYREEPVAFFFVLFGLAYEALVDQTNVSSSQRLEILRALNRILRPAVSGNAIYQDAVFSETMDTLDRLALTEGTGIQTVIVDIARNLSLDHQSANGEERRGDSLSEDIEQLFELTRSIILVLANLLPNLGDSTPHARFNISSDDSISLIQLSLSSLVDVASVFPSVIRPDLHACIFHIFSTILATGICQAEVVPQALPIFRRFVQGITRPSGSNSSTDVRAIPTDNAAMISVQIRGSLARFLTILTIAQRRESETSLPCAKNTLLALTILLTTSGHAIPPQDPLLPRVLNEFLDCLQDLGLAKVVAGCIRSLLLIPAPRSPTDDVIARFLIPRLVAFVTGVSKDGEPASDPENTRTMIAHSLVSCVGSATIPRDGLPTAMSMVVSCLLTRCRQEGESVYQETAARLLELAKTDQSLFRELLAGIDPEQRAFVEGILKSTGAGSDSRKDGKTGSPEEEKQVPSIALRMDF